MDEVFSDLGGASDVSAQRPADARKKKQGSKKSGPKKTTKPYSPLHEAGDVTNANSKSPKRQKRNKTARIVVDSGSNSNSAGNGATARSPPDQAPLRSGEGYGGPSPTTCHQPPPVAATAVANSTGGLSNRHNSTTSSLGSGGGLFVNASSFTTQRTGAAGGSSLRQGEGSGGVAAPTVANGANLPTFRKKGISVAGGYDTESHSSCDDNDSHSSRTQEPPAGQQQQDNSGGPKSPKDDAVSPEMHAQAVRCHLTDQEIKQLRVLFDSIDENGNGLLSIDELMRAMRHLGFSLSRVQVVTLVREVAFELYSEAKFKAAEKAPLNRSGHSANITPSTSLSGRPVTSGGTSLLQRSMKRRAVLEWSGAVIVDDDDEIEVDFDDFVKIISLWQGAAQFQVFEHRTSEAVDHISRAQRTDFFLPDSYPMWAWNVVMLLVLGYTWFAVLMAHAFTFESQLWLFSVTTAPDFIAFLLNAVDVVIRVNTAFLRKEDGRTWLVDDRKSILRHYAATWLCIDLLAVIPLRFFFFFGGSTSHDLDAQLFSNTTFRGATGRGYGATMDGDLDTVYGYLQIAIWLNHLRLLKTFKVQSLIGSSLRMHVNKPYIVLYYVVAPALMGLFKFACLLHLLAIVLIQVRDKFVFRTKSSVFVPTTEQPEQPSFQAHGQLTYARAIYTVMYFVSTAGFGDLPSLDNETKVYYMFLICVGMAMNGLVVGSMVSFFQRSDIDSSRKAVILELNAVLSYFEVPKGLKAEILRFQNHLQLNDLMRTHESTVCNLPPEMQHNLVLFVRVRAISAVPFFADIHNSAKILLCQNLLPVIFCPEELIVAFGEIGEEMFFVNYGFVDVLSAASKYIVTLTQGHYFGEMALLSEEPIERTATVKSVTYCDLFVLRKRGFREVLNRFPRFRAQIEKVAVERRAQAKAAAPPLPLQPPTAVNLSAAPSTGNGTPSAGVSVLGLTHGVGSRKKSFKSISIVDAKLLQRDPVQKALAEALMAVAEQQANAKAFSPEFHECSFAATDKAPAAAAVCEGLSSSGRQVGGITRDETARPESSMSSFGSSIHEHRNDGVDDHGLPIGNGGSLRSATVLRGPAARPLPGVQELVSTGSLNSGGYGSPARDLPHVWSHPELLEHSAVALRAAGTPGAAPQSAQPLMQGAEGSFQDLQSMESWQEDFPRLSVTYDETTMEINGPKAAKASGSSFREDREQDHMPPSHLPLRPQPKGVEGNPLLEDDEGRRGTSLPGSLPILPDTLDESTEKKFSICSATAAAAAVPVPPQLPAGLPMANSPQARPVVQFIVGPTSPAVVSQPLQQQPPQQPSSARWSGLQSSTLAISLGAQVGELPVSSGSDVDSDSREASAGRFIPARSRGVLARQPVTVEELHSSTQRFRADLEQELETLSRAQLADLVQVLIREALDTEQLVNELAAGNSPQMINGRPIGADELTGRNAQGGALRPQRTNSFRSISFFSQLAAPQQQPRTARLGSTASNGLGAMNRFGLNPQSSSHGGLAALTNSGDGRHFH